MSTIKSSTTTTTAYSVDADTTGALVIQTGATPTTAVTVAATQNVGIGMTPVASYGLLQIGSAVTSAAGVTGLQSFVSATNSAVGQNGNLAIMTTTAQAADIGGSIVLGGKFVAAGTSAPFAMIAGRKENSTDNNGAGYLQFSTLPNGGSTTERMRVDSSGNLLVGTTSVFSSGKQCIAFTGSTVQGLNIRNNADNPADTFVGFYNAYGTKVGSITAGGSTTTYNTSSDYRLKENVQPSS
jgi:hypothetical protein